MLNKVKKFNSIYLIIGFALVGLIFPLHSSQAAWLWDMDDIVNLISWVAYNILIYWMGTLISLETKLVIFVANFNHFTDLDQIKDAWRIVRDIANMFYIAILLVIAFGTIFRVEAYAWKKLLPKMILAAILVNYSRAICGILVDAAQIVLLTFANAISDAASVSIVRAFGIDNLLQLNKGSLEPSTDTADAMAGQLGISNPKQLLLIILTAGLLFGVMAFVLLVYIVVLMARLVFIWFLTVLSPLAFTLMILPATEKYYKQWWEIFVRYVTVGPMILFFLWLSLYISSKTENIANDVSTSTEYQAAEIIDNSSTSAAGAMQPSELAKAILAIMMLLAGLKMAQDNASEIGSVVSKATSLGKTLATGALLWKIAKGGWRNGGSYVGKMAGQKVVDLNDRRWANGKYDFNLLRQHKAKQEAKEQERQRWRTTGELKSEEAFQSAAGAKGITRFPRMWLRGKLGAAGSAQRNYGTYGIGLHYVPGNILRMVANSKRLGLEGSGFQNLVNKHVKGDPTSKTFFGGNIGTFFGRGSMRNTAKAKAAHNAAHAAGQKVQELEERLKDNSISRVQRKALQQKLAGAKSKQAMFADGGLTGTKAEVASQKDYLGTKLAEKKAAIAAEQAKGDKADPTVISKLEKDVKNLDDVINGKTDPKTKQTVKIEGNLLAEMKKDSEGEETRLLRQLRNKAGQNKVEVADDEKGLAAYIAAQTKAARDKAHDLHTKATEADKKSIPLVDQSANAKLAELMHNEMKKFGDEENDNVLRSYLRSAFESNNGMMFAAITEHLSKKGHLNEALQEFNCGEGIEGMKSLSKIMAGLNGLNEQISYEVLNNCSREAKKSDQWEFAEAITREGSEYRFRSDAEIDDRQRFEMSKGNMNSICNRGNRFVLGGYTKADEHGNKEFVPNAARFAMIAESFPALRKLILDGRMNTSLAEHLARFLPQLVEMSRNIHAGNQTAQDDITTTAELLKTFVASNSAPDKSGSAARVEQAKKILKLAA